MIAKCLIISAVILSQISNCLGQSWIYDRCIKSSKQSINQITAYIIPCSEQDSTISEEVVIDSSCFIRQIEKFDAAGNIVFSSEPVGPHLPKSQLVKIFNYNANSLISINEFIDTIKHRTIKYNELSNGQRNIVYENWIDSTDLISLIESDTIQEVKIEYQTQLLGEHSTGYTQTLYNQKGESIQSTYFYDGNVYTTIIQRSENNSIKKIISINPNNKITTTEYKSVSYSSGKINLTDIEINPESTSVYLEVLDHYGNVIRHIIIDSEKKCKTVWHYDIEYN